MARLKSSADLVTAIEPAVRFYEEPPDQGDGRSRRHWADLWLSADDWAEAFDAPEPGTPHNEARDQVWEELLTILVDKHRRRRRARPTCSARSLRAERASCCDRVQPRVAAARGDRPRRRPVVGAGLPAPVRALAQPRRGPRAAARGRRRPGRCPTCRCSTRPGSGSATRRRRGAGVGTTAAVAAEREQMARSSTHLIATDDSEMHVMSMLRGEDLQDALVDDAALPERRPRPARRPVRARRRGRGAGADRRRVADAAAALPVAQLHHRRRPRPGPARVHRVVAGAARAGRARPGRRWPR